MDDSHGATRHLIAREAYLRLIDKVPAGPTPHPIRYGVLARKAWLFADAFVAESILEPHERAALKETN